MDDIEVLRSEMTIDTHYREKEIEEIKEVLNSLTLSSPIKMMK